MMGFFVNVIFLVFIFQRIYSFLIISMTIKKLDDCIRKIELDDGIVLFEKETSRCTVKEEYTYNEPIFGPIPYEIGENIKIIVGDATQGCGLRMEILVNNNKLADNNIKFWKCNNCNSFNYDGTYKWINCGPNVDANNYSFYFNISSLEQLDFNTSEYFYYLNNTNNIYILSPDFNNAINLIDLYSENILYAKNSEGNIIKFSYKYIYYKLFFDDFKTHKGKFIGSDESNNDIELDDNTYSRIFENKNLRYEPSDEEKNNKEAYIRFKIGIYNNQKKLISELHDLNFIICLQDYLDCYKNCTYFYYLDEIGNKICTESYSCPEEYNKFIIDKRECIKNCELDNVYKYEFKNKCYSQCPIESKKSINNKYHCEAICDEVRPFVIIETQECVELCDINELLKSCNIRYIREIIEEDYGNIKEEKQEKIEEIKTQDKILEIFEKGFTSENYDTSEIDKGNDFVAKNEKMTISLTTIDSQKNNKNDTLTKVDIGPCEDILRSVYNISSDKILYMKKIEVNQEGMKIPKIEYDIYCKLNDTNLINSKPLHIKRKK